MVEKLATACEKFVNLGQTEQPFLLHQPRDGSIFDTFITSETISSQVVLQGAKQVSTPDLMAGDPMFWNQIFAASSRSAGLCVVGHCHGGEKHHHYRDQDLFSCPLVGNSTKLLHQCFFCTHASNCMTSFAYINDTGDFNEFGILNNRTLKLLWYTIIFNTIQRGKAYPKEWKMDVVCPIYKNKLGSLIITEDCHYHQQYEKIFPVFWPVHWMTDNE